MLITNSMEGLVIIIGESFRTGGQGTRLRGLPESYHEQMNACNTHIRFLDHLHLFTFQTPILTTLKK